ncbi:hypothetical protein N5D48_09620 [Pseudomonas sp. GD03858]|uniref:hypothetical protein n=1 Tax=unclassified Pseudomonas TaxID=196821 RepID=UPI00244D222C|nr:MULTISPECIES: hypothetical protein [unclassified Pseudomonas]MDH0646727.1 hypothetical protein [Pseudomonas sp. GD03867]MDH0662658.1 hypothetical protein [Pseudomonas sp. GD03858]
MMIPLGSIIHSISPGATLKSATESTEDYTTTYNCSALNTNFEALAEVLEEINSRDSFTLAFTPRSSETSFSLSSRDPVKIEEFYQNLKFWNDAFGSLSGSLKLRIGKVAQRKTLSIYSLSAFAEYLCNGSPAEVIGKLFNLAKTAYYLESSELNQLTKSSLLCFGPKLATDNYPTNPEPSYKSKHIELRSKACSVYANIDTNFIPSDFVFDKSILGHPLSETFDRLSLICCLMALSDITKIDSSGEIAYTVKGYTTEKLSITNLSDVDTSSIHQYLAVYQWAYTEGNIIDKLGICRNLLTIHATDGKLLKLKEGWLESITSNHSIYLKDNLKQYIDLKNKLSEQIQKGSEKASDIAKNITNYLRTSIFSLTSFLFSAFLVRTLAKPTAAEPSIITPSVYWLFLLIAGISLAILAYALAETNAEKIRYIKSYKAFKSRYTDLLSKEDISFIFNNDKDFNRDINYIKRTRKKSVILWLCILTITTSIVTVMRINCL